MPRAQVSVEYLVILAFTLMIAIPSVYLFSTFTQTSGASMAAAQYGRLGQEIVATALETLAQGEGSWLTLDVNLPEDILNITTVSEGPRMSDIIITYPGSTGPTDVIVFSDIDLSNSTTDATPQNGTIFEAEPHGGKVSFRFTALPGGIVAVREYRP